MSSRRHDKKRVVSINLGNYGSTGTIMKGISRIAEEKGYETFLAYPENERNHPPAANDIIIMGERYLRACKKLSYRTGYNGCFAILPTAVFLAKLNRIDPDIVHLHNLHNSYINLPMLFAFLKRKKVKVIWTLHDCWAFTGHCPHFTMAKCSKWKTGCGGCPQMAVYPPMKRDKSKEVWRLKKKWFTGVGDMTVVTPSQWLADLVKQSFLSGYPVRVINNGVDLNVFRPAASDIRRKYGIGADRFIVLGVAFDWGERKGLDVFIRLSELLPIRYQIVLIGTDESIDKTLPDRVLSIHRTQNREELAQWYTAADVFVNPTREDTFPTVNIESLACGTPVVTFRTGGSPEMLDRDTGVVVENEDMGALVRAITETCGHKNAQKCIGKAARYDESVKFKEYAALY